MIVFENFSFRYEESEEFTLKDINATVGTGEFILLTGRSGCGKTTLIRSLNGLIPHFYPGEMKGDIRMDGDSLLDMKPSQLAGKVGTVFQDPRSQFFMTDTTRELAFGCENMGYQREETVERIAKAVADLELADYLNRSIFALSSGEKQQVAIGSVYALQPKVYIFDEPSANLDYEATKRLAQIMAKLKQDGYTIFVVEHRFYYLRDLIDRVFLIQDGQIGQEFTRESVLTGLLGEKNGEICYDGKKLSPHKRRSLSYLVMQDTDYQLFGSSVEEELSLGVSGDPSEKVTETLEVLELLAYREQHPAALSGGQKQRVTIGAAIVKDSPVIYFDEPTSGLDYDSMVRISRLIEQLSEAGIIIFVVSHDFEFIVRTCTEVLQLDDEGVVHNRHLTSGILKSLSEKYFN